MTIEMPDRSSSKRRLPFGRGASASSSPGSDLPRPTLLVPDDRVDIRIAGIGGTGVVTVAQVLGTAAMLDGFDVRGLDQTGLSQKAGPVVSDLRLSKNGPAESNLLGAGEADVLLAFDLLVGSDEKALASARADHSVVIASSSQTPTGSMVGHPEIDYPTLRSLIDRVATKSRAEHNRFADSAGLTRGLVGDGAPANIFMLGVAIQAGAIPVDPEAIEQAIELNGVAVEANLAAFDWGRRWVIDREGVEQAAGLDAVSSSITPVDVHVPTVDRKLARRIGDLELDQSLADVVEMLAADLVGYQDAGYANRFLDTVAAAVSAERSTGSGQLRFAEAVARSLHKLMAYKDEYEVARLLIGPEAEAAAEAVGGPGAKVSWRLHPPLLRALGMETKLSLPARTTRPVMAALAAGKRLRGTALDPFGRAEVRRAERAIIGEYLAAIESVMARLTASGPEADVAEAIRVAELPMAIRGYEHLKMDRIEAFRTALAQLD